MRDADLFERLAEIVVVAHDSGRLGDRLLELVLAMTRGRSAAVFKPGGKALRLLLSRGIDQDAIEAVQSIWARFRPALEAGETFYVADREADRGHRAALRAFPRLVPESPDDEGAETSRRARDFWRERWQGQTLMAIGLRDPVLGEPVMRALRGDIRACPEPMLLPEAGHFVQEHGERIAREACAFFGR